MRPTRQQKIRELLLQKRDGMSVEEITRHTNFDRANVNTAIKGMPDVYVDRWEPNGRGAYRKVYVAVYVPDDCPHPKDQIFRGGRGKAPQTKWIKT